MNFRSPGLFISLVLIVATSVGTRVAQADLVWAIFDPSTETYRYDIAHMPDLDQRREIVPPFIEGLPNAGSMYCAPTATMNIFMYLADHGFPEIDPPGQAFWQLQSLYTDVTRLIFALGEEMGTDPVDGTDGAGWPDGARAWLDPYDRFTIDTNYAIGNYTPTLADMALSAVNGSLVALGYTRYLHFPFETVCDLGVCDLALGGAIGGHVTTLAHASRTLPFGRLLLGVRDPADGDFDKTRQSFFKTTYFDIEQHPATSTEGWSRTVEVLNLNVTSTSVSVLTGYIMINPKAGFTLVDGGHEILQRVPYGLSNHTPTRSDPIRAPIGATIVSVTEQPDHLGYLAMLDFTGGQNALYLFNTLTGSTEHLLDISDFTAMALARNRSLYVLREDGFGDSVVQRISLDSQTAVAAGMEVLAAEAIAADDVNDEVVLLQNAPIGGTIRRFNFALSEQTWVAEVDSDVPIGNQPRIAVGPTDGLLWLLSDAADEIYGLSRDGDLVESVPIPGPSDFAFDDKGNLFVGSEGFVIELRRVAPGIWEEVEESVFAGLETSGLVGITRSRSNYVPEMDLAISPKHIDPEDVVAGIAVPDGTADVSPGSPENVLNINSEGVVRVAILTTEGLNAEDIDPTTVTFGRLGHEAQPVNSILRDADGDQDIDLVFHFWQPDTGILCGDTMASLMATTFNGRSFSAFDFIRTVGCN